jgi:hypothetical protein
VDGLKKYNARFKWKANFVATVIEVIIEAILNLVATYDVIKMTIKIWWKTI